MREPCIALNALPDGFAKSVLGIILILGIFMLIPTIGIVCVIHSFFGKIFLLQKWSSKINIPETEGNINKREKECMTILLIKYDFFDRYLIYVDFQTNYKYILLKNEIKIYWNLRVTTVTTIVI